MVVGQEERLAEYSDELEREREARTEAEVQLSLARPAIAGLERDVESMTRRAEKLEQVGHA